MGEHRCNQFHQWLRERRAERENWRQIERRGRGIVTGQKEIERGTEAINIGADRALRSAILLWRGKARRAKRRGISDLARLETARNAKIDQVETTTGRAHNIGWLHIAKDNRRLKLMQVLQNVAKLTANINYFFERQARLLKLLEIFIERLTIYEIHHQVPVRCIGEMLVQARQVWMVQRGKQAELAIICVGRLDSLGRAERIQFNRFNRHQAIFPLSITRLVDCTEAAGANFPQNLVATMQKAYFRLRLPREPHRCDGVFSKGELDINIWLLPCFLFARLVAFR